MSETYNDNIYIILQNIFKMTLQMKQLNLFCKKKKNFFISQYKKILTTVDTKSVVPDIVALMKEVGTYSLNDLLELHFGKQYLKDCFSNSEIIYPLLTFFHPISYAVIQEKNLSSNQKDISFEDLDEYNKSFYLKVFGIKVIFKNIVVTGILDNVLHFRNPKKKLINALTLKEQFLLDSNKINKLYADAKRETDKIKNSTLATIMKTFVTSDLYLKRATIWNFLVQDEIIENQNYVYFFFEILKNDFDNKCSDYIKILESLPFHLQVSLDNIMNEKQKAETSSNVVDKIPYENQIMFMKVDEIVKEKALLKLKDLKSKSDESANKARQYIEGLLKIPFGFYKKEKVLSIVQTIRQVFSKLEKSDISLSLPISSIRTKLDFFDYNISKKHVKCGNYTEAYQCIKNYLSKLYPNQKQELISSGQYETYVKKFIKLNKRDPVFTPLLKELTQTNIKDIKTIKSLFSQLNSDVEHIHKIMDKSVYGHKDAKQKLKQILGHWIHGSNTCQQGYCIGFEGPPGVGKTSLAKYGLSECLIDDQYKKRPLFIIALGGDSNGSSLQGHQYTYLGSIWGSIVQILMDSKCMNPIILFDEVDKISKSEHGKEITGILTHLLDYTQNQQYQDKYFTGIDLDLSKAIFILSYNDPSQIDKVLLDRIERIKFKALTTKEKISICKTFFLPQLFESFSLQNVISFTDEVLEFIIEEYTYESGCRRLKQLLTQIIGLVNFDLLQEKPLPEAGIITKEKIKSYYFAELSSYSRHNIHDEDCVGVINCLYANDYGKGGILKTVAKQYPCDHFLGLKLTGLLDEMMKESFDVAKTLAWNLTPKDIQATFDKNFGIHIHCGEGSISKSGTSAGVAITLLVYSILNNKKIPNDIAVTGEISLDGQVEKIGALDLKINGGIKSGIKRFVFPTENILDYEKFRSNEIISDDIQFFPVKTIYEVIPLVFS